MATGVDLHNNLRRIDNISGLCCIRDRGMTCKCGRVLGAFHNHLCKSPSHAIEMPLTLVSAPGHRGSCFGCSAPVVGQFVHAARRGTDRQTDRRTDEQTPDRCITLTATAQPVYTPIIKRPHETLAESGNWERCKLLMRSLIVLSHWPHVATQVEQQVAELVARHVFQWNRSH